MKRVRSLSSLVLAASVVLAPAAQAAGMIMIDPVPGVVMPHVMMPPIGRPGIVRPPVGIVAPVPPNPGHRPPNHVTLEGGVSFGLHLKDEDVRVEINDQIAKTYISQTFINDTANNVAGTYLFPLPADTTFSSFSLHIDGKPVEGKILEANEARQQYEEIVRRMVDPGLLEYADYKTVRARIFPIPAHGEKKVELEYTQILKAENGLLKYSFPLKAEGETQPADSIKVSVKMNSKQGVRTIWSPSHQIDVNKQNDHSAKIAYLGRDVLPDKDFQLYYNISDKDMVANILAHKDSGEDGYYMLTVTPPVEAKQTSNKDIVMVVDTSGSMQGERMEKSKKALKYLINALNSGDRFSLVKFNTDVDPLNGKLMEANAANKKKAIEWVDDLEAVGGTNISDALKTASTILDEPAQVPGYLVLMTDGEPTVGETSVNGLLKSFHPKRDIRLFDFGVGYDVNTKLLSKLADDHHGTSQYVEPNEDLEVSLSGFYRKIKSPVLSNVKIAYDGVQVKDIYPREVKDIFAGQQVILLGKYKTSGNGSIKISGTVNGVAKAYTFPIAMPGNEAGNTYLPRLWAMRRIGHLSEVAQENGDSREVVDEIVALSKRYGIISDYTSFLVTDPSENTRIGGGVRQMNLNGPMGRSAMMRSAPAVGMSVAGSGGRFNFAAHSANASVAAAAPMMAMEAMDARAQRGLTGGPVRAIDAVSGKRAVVHAKAIAMLKDSDQTYGDEGVRDANKKGLSGARKIVEDKTFYLSDGIWTDSTFDGKAKGDTIKFASKEYFDLLKSQPGIGKFLAVGQQVILVFHGKVYKIVMA